MATLNILAAGILATLLVVIALASWLAIGSLLRLGIEDRLTETSVQIAFGAAVSSALYALLAAFGQVSLALVLVPGLGVLALVVALLRNRISARNPVPCGAPLASGVQVGKPLWTRLRHAGGSKAVPMAAAVVGLVYWVVAITPPRDADVMRYHLAHIRQILADGAWQPIADYHYALPFGWTFNYLPFERLNLPQGANLLNLGLAVLSLALLYRIMAQVGDRKVALALAAVAATQPLLLKSATTAFADMYLIFIVTMLTALLTLRNQVSARNLVSSGGAAGAAFALGFVSWIGAQSRYQALALGLASALVVGVRFVRRSVTRTQMRYCATGVTLAVFLALPFYLFNLVHFRNPVWPLLTSVFNRPPTYADLVVAAYNQSQTGTWRVSTVIQGLKDAFVSPYTFPIPFVVFGLLIISARWRTAVSARLALFLGAFMVLWVAAQPALYARFFIYLVPLAWAGVAALIPVQKPGVASGALRLQRPGFLAGRLVVGAPLAISMSALVALALAALSLFYSYDSFVYVATGDLDRYHASTWFYPVYDWVNHNTPADARLLVVVTSGHSYYLDRPYRRADPWLSGVVDWSAVHDANDLVRVMQDGRYRYLFYEQRDWAEYLGGRQMASAVEQAVANGVLRMVKQFDVNLATSRVQRQGYMTSVVLLELSGGRNVVSAGDLVSEPAD